MSTLRIDESIIDFLIKELFIKGHLCIIGGSKCAKSKLADEMLRKILLNKKYSKTKTNDNIPGIAFSTTYKCPEYDKPITYLRNVSGLALLNFEKLYRENILITTFPVTSLNLLLNRFIAFNEDYRSINNFDERLWSCIPLIAENKVLGNGCAYMMSCSALEHVNGTIHKEQLCLFERKRGLFEEDFSSVHGKYIILKPDEV